MYVSRHLYKVYSSKQLVGKNCTVTYNDTVSVDLQASGTALDQLLHMLYATLAAGV